MHHPLLLVIWHSVIHQIETSKGPIGTRYVDFADQTNGLIENICADDFSTIVSELSLRSSRLNDIFFYVS